MRTNDPIPLPLLAVGTPDAQGFNLAGTPGDVAVFDVPYKCQVIEAGLIITQDVAGSTTLGVVAFDKRPTAGNDASRGDADVANFILDDLAAAPVAGNVVVIRPAARIVLLPGQQVVAQLVTAATGTPTGHYMPYLLAGYIPEEPANMAQVIELV